MRGEGEQELSDDSQVADRGTTDGNEETQRRSKTSGVWEGGREKGDLVLRSLRWLWVGHTSRNVKERDSSVVLMRARERDLEVKSTLVYLKPKE